MAKRSKEQSAAIITVKRAGDMTKTGRRRIANWLRHHAKMLEEHGKEYSGRFTGRYLYR